MMMTEDRDDDRLLTEAQRGSGVILVRSTTNSTNARNVPYAERYRQLTGIYETPAEHIQRAAESDEQLIG